MTTVNVSWALHDESPEEREEEMGRRGRNRPKSAPMSRRSHVAPPRDRRAPRHVPQHIPSTDEDSRSRKRAERIKNRQPISAAWARPKSATSTAKRNKKPTIVDPMKRAQARSRNGIRARERSDPNPERREKWSYGNSVRTTARKQCWNNSTDTRDSQEYISSYKRDIQRAKSFRNNTYSGSLWM